MSTETAAVAPRKRADARRNRDAVVEVARELFSAGSADVPFEEIARQAGVGKATLYRHFPTREHLIAVVIDHEVEALRNEAERAIARATHAGATDRSVRSALDGWLRLYYQAARRFGVVSAQLGQALGNPHSPVGAACEPMRSGFADLWSTARTAKIVRNDITPDQVLTLVSGLPDAHDASAGAPYLDVVLRGLAPSIGLLDTSS